MTTNNVISKSKTVEISCKLTTTELQDFRSTVVESLKKQVVQTKNLANGCAFKFIGTDKMLDDIIGYIKTERRCCGFIVFNVFINGNEMWLELTGPEGTKEFLSGELGF